MSLRWPVILAVLVGLLPWPQVVGASGYAPLALTPNDPAWEQQVEMRRIEADRAWEVTTGRPEVIIAILDTGVSTSHVDLAGKVLPGRNFVTGRAGQNDDEGHGTMTASVAAGIGNNGAGMAGVCWACRVMPLKIFNRNDSSDSAFAEAIRHAADNGARVINISAGGINPSPVMEEAVNYASDKGMLVVVSAGNTPDNLPLYPASYEKALAVAASGLNDNVTGFSTYADWVDLAAPGINITGADRLSRNGVTHASGTSFSAPLVAGAAGLLFSLRPDLSAQQARMLLLDTAVDIGDPGRDNNFGAGRLSIYDAVLAAARPAAGGGATAQGSTNGAQVRLTAGGFAPGERLRVWLTNGEGRVIVLRGLAADGSGALTHNAGLTTESPRGPYDLTILGEASRRVAIVSVGGGGGSAEGATAFRPVPDRGDGAWFPETGHTLRGPFRDYWATKGGVALFGFPISEEFRELNRTDGKVYTVQYFERNRFELHPEAPPEFRVQLGLLGSLLTGDRTFPTAPSAESTPERRYFPETRHTLAGNFLTYWEANGGLAIFGFPISEPQEEDGRIVQYFERNRFELHPEAPPEFRVLLGLLGRDLARRNGYL